MTYFDGSPWLYESDQDYDREGRGDALDERYLMDRAEHEAHAGDGDEEPDLDEDESEPAWRSLKLLPLIDAYVAKMRELPEDAADDESRYGDSLEIAKTMRAEIKRRVERVRDGDDPDTWAMSILDGKAR